MSDHDDLSNATMMRVSQYLDPGIVVTNRDVALLQVQALCAISVGIAEIRQLLEVILKESES